MKAQDPKAESITFGVELETTIPTTSDIGVGAYHVGTSVVEGIATESRQRVNAPTFNGNHWKAEILWLKLVAGAALEKRGGVPRVSVGYRENTRIPQPIQNQ